MIKKELKASYKSLLIWSVVIMGLFLLVFLIYPTLIDKMDPALMDSYLELLPKEMLQTMNFDLVDIMSAFGWFKSEGVIMILLIGGMYASLLGGGLLLNEESEGSINYLLSKPISREKIFINKLISGFILLTSFILLTFVFIFWGYELTAPYDFNLLVLMYLNMALVLYVIYTISFFISTFFRNNKIMVTISIGMVFFFYIINVVGGLSDDFSWISNLSVFSLIPVRDIIQTSKLDILRLVVGFLISILMILLAKHRFKEKDFY